MTSEKDEKLDVVANQPLRSDKIPSEPFIDSRGEGTELYPHSDSALNAVQGILRRFKRGIVSPNKRINNQTSKSKRRAIVARKKFRKAQRLARRHNRGVKGHTQLRSWR